MLLKLLLLIILLGHLTAAQRSSRWNQPAEISDEMQTAGDIAENTGYVTKIRQSNRRKMSNYERRIQNANERQVQYRKTNLFQTLNIDPNSHKCPVWVPIDSVHKYQGAKVIQTDQAHQLQLVEICCAGFHAMQSRGQFVCRPTCENCANGFCQAPNDCLCYEGFVRNDNGDCVFACPIDCLNGRCYLDGSCQCDAGYKLDETRKFCRPICSAGCGLNPRHNCTEPEICGCAKGYKLTDDGCQPICQPDCGLGGNCIEVNVCKCSNGYTLKDGVCQSDCYQKCDNGICYNRNRCICNAGYIYHERSTQCIPK